MLHINKPVNRHPMTHLRPFIRVFTHATFPDPPPPRFVTQISSRNADPVEQSVNFAATHVAHEEVIGVEEPTQAARGQPSEGRKARNAPRRRRY